MALHTNQNEASPSLGAANCETDATFGGSWEAQRRSYANQNEASPSLGAANSEAVATFVGSWEAQRSRVIRKKE